MPAVCATFDIASILITLSAVFFFLLCKIPQIMTATDWKVWRFFFLCGFPDEPPPEGHEA